MAPPHQFNSAFAFLKKLISFPGLMNPVALKMEGLAITNLFIGIPLCEMLDRDVDPLIKIS